MSSNNNGISKNITKRKSVTFIPKDHLGIKNSTTNLNPKTKSKRKSVISSSTIASPSNKSNSSGKTKKTKIKITTTLKVEKSPQKIGGRRGSYCDLFKLKQNYVSNDFTLTQKPESGYSILYKDGVRVFDEIEKGNVNSSIKSSFVLSNNRSKNSLSPNRRNRRRGSVEGSLFGKFNLLASEKKEIDDYIKSMDNKRNRRRSVEFKGTSAFYKNLLGKKNENSSSISSSSSSSSNNSSNLSRKNSSSHSVKNIFKGEKIDDNETNKQIEKKRNELKSSFKKSFNSNERRKSMNKKNKKSIIELVDCDKNEEKKDIINQNLKNEIKERFKKYDILKEQSDKINNLEEDLKRQIIKRFNSLKSDSKITKELKLSDKEIEKFLKRSHSQILNLKNKKYNMKNIGKIIMKNELKNEIKERFKKYDIIS